MHAVVYHPINCMKCKLTMSKLELPVEEQVIQPGDTSDPIVNYMHTNSLFSAPLVRILDEADNIVDEWNDFRFDKITQTNQAFRETDLVNNTAAL